MEIVLSEMPPGGRRFAGTAAVQVVSDGGEVESPHPVAFGLWAIRDGAELHVRGWLSTTVVAVCDRCLDSFERFARRDVEVTYAAAEDAGDDGASELDESELDLDYYRNDAVDLRALLAEQVALALPMKLLCDDDCRGLCPRCGTRLNERQCDCDPVVDPRLAPLAALREHL